MIRPEITPPPASSTCSPSTATAAWARAVRSGAVRRQRFVCGLNSSAPRTVPLRAARAHAAVAVLGEQVLLAGGGVISGRIIASAEIYDPD